MNSKIILYGGRNTRSQDLQATRSNYEPDVMPILHPLYKNCAHTAEVCGYPWSMTRKSTNVGKCAISYEIVPKKSVKFVNFAHTFASCRPFFTFAGQECQQKRENLRRLGEYTSDRIWMGDNMANVTCDRSLDATCIVLKGMLNGILCYSGKISGDGGSNHPLSNTALPGATYVCMVAANS